MTYSIEEERDSLWLEVENLTGMRFINRKKPPEALSEYSDEAKEAIKKLKNVYQRINNREDVRRLSYIPDADAGAYGGLGRSARDHARLYIK